MLKKALTTLVAYIIAWLPALYLVPILDRIGTAIDIRPTFVENYWLCVIALSFAWSIKKSTITSAAKLIYFVFGMVVLLVVAPFIGEIDAIPGLGFSLVALLSLGKLASRKPSAKEWLVLGGIWFVLTALVLQEAYSWERVLF